LNTNRINPAPRLAVAGGMPTAPGWWIQWCDRTDWRPVAADFAAWVADQLIDGERLVYIEPRTEMQNV
jgi:hypothetical protein